jgi:lactobin A/cerein 7B family class IIb bacteriocin
MRLAYGNVLLDKRRKIMIASYGETSGFSPVSNAELENINGGFAGWEIAVIISFAIGGSLITAASISSPKNTSSK